MPFVVWCPHKATPTMAYMTEGCQIPEMLAAAAASATTQTGRTYAAAGLGVLSGIEAKRTVTPENISDLIETIFRVDEETAAEVRRYIHENSTECPVCEALSRQICRS